MRTCRPGQPRRRMEPATLRHPRPSRRTAPAPACHRPSGYSWLISAIFSWPVREHAEVPAERTKLNRAERPPARASCARPGAGRPAPGHSQPERKNSGIPPGKRPEHHSVTARSGRRAANQAGTATCSQGVDESGLGPRTTGGVEHRHNSITGLAAGVGTRYGHRPLQRGPDPQRRPCLALAPASPSDRRHPVTQRSARYLTAVHSTLAASLIRRTPVPQPRPAGVLVVATVGGQVGAGGGGPLWRCYRRCRSGCGPGRRAARGLW